MEVRIEGGWRVRPKGPSIKFRTTKAPGKPEEELGIDPENVGELTFSNGEDAIRLMKEYYPVYVSRKCWLSISARTGSFSCAMPRNLQETLDLVRKELDFERQRATLDERLSVRSLR